MDAGPVAAAFLVIPAGAGIRDPALGKCAADVGFPLGVTIRACYLGVKRAAIRIFVGYQLARPVAVGKRYRVDIAKLDQAV